MQTYTYDSVAELVYHPAARALLDTIASVETVGANPEQNGYGALHSTVMSEVGGGFDPYSVSDHPYLINRTLPKYHYPNGQTATPAGRYQFLASTWRNAIHPHGFKGVGFDPNTQDRAALVRAQNDRNGAVERLVEASEGSGVDEVVLSQVYTDLSPEWRGLVDSLTRRGFERRYQGLLTYYRGVSSRVHFFSASISVPDIREALPAARAGSESVPGNAKRIDIGAVKSTVLRLTAPSSARRSEVRGPFDRQWAPTVVSTGARVTIDLSLRKDSS